MSQEMSEAEITEAARLLSKLSPGFLPAPIFQEFTRLGVAAIIEIVPLRQRDSLVEILLLRRSADDPTWPNQLHTPGTVLRSTDTTYESAFARIFEEELHVELHSPVFVKNLLHNSSRGMESAHVHWVEILATPIYGEWYNADSLPPELVSSQRDFIPSAVESFRKSRH